MNYGNNYPLSLGRNFDELKRVLIGLPTAGSCGVAKDRMEAKEEGVTCYDWFFCTKKLSKEKVEAALGKKK